MKTFSTSQVGSLIYNFRLEKKKFIYLFISTLFYVGSIQVSME